MTWLIYVAGYILGALQTNYQLRNWTVDGEGVTGWDYIEMHGHSPWVTVALWFIAVPWALCKIALRRWRKI